jgi:thiol-disulfide isomerase/thioredoxin
MSRAGRRVFALACLLAVATAGCRRTGRADAGTPPDARLPAPYPVEAFAAVDLAGAAIDLADWKGRVVIVNVWATWCAPCRREMPALSAMQARHPEDVRVLGLLQDQVTDDFAREFLRVARVTYPVVRSSFDIERRLPAVAVLPTTYLIDPEGRLVAMFGGEVDTAVLEREVRHLLGR